MTNTVTCRTCHQSFFDGILNGIFYFPLKKAYSKSDAKIDHQHSIFYCASCFQIHSLKLMEAKQCKLCQKYVTGQGNDLIIKQDKFRMPKMSDIKPTYFVCGGLFQRLKSFPPSLLESMRNDDTWCKDCRKDLIKNGFIEKVNKKFELVHSEECISCFEYSSDYVSFYTPKQFIKASYPNQRFELCDSLSLDVGCKICSDCLTNLNFQQLKNVECDLCHQSSSLHDSELSKWAHSVDETGINCGFGGLNPFKYEWIDKPCLNQGVKTICNLCLDKLEKDFVIMKEEQTQIVWY